MLFGQSAGAGSVSAHVAMPRSSDLFSAALMQSGGFAGWSAQHMKLKLEGTGRRQFFYGFPICFLCFLCFCMFLWIPTNVIKLGKSPNSMENSGCENHLWRGRVWLPEGTVINTWLGLPFFWVREFPNTNFLSSIGMMNPQLLRICFSIGFAWLKPLSFRLGWEIHRNAQYMVGVSSPLRKEFWFQRFMKQSGCHDVQCLVDLPAEELLTAYLSLPGRRHPGDFSQSHWSDLPIREPASYWASHFTW